MFEEGIAWYCNYISDMLNGRPLWLDSTTMNRHEHSLIANSLNKEAHDVQLCLACVPPLAALDRVSADLRCTAKHNYRAQQGDKTPHSLTAAGHQLDAVREARIDGRLVLWGCCDHECVAMIGSTKYDLESHPAGLAADERE